jgi:hypothetical protein
LLAGYNACRRDAGVGFTRFLGDSNPGPAKVPGANLQQSILKIEF